MAAATTAIREAAKMLAQMQKELTQKQAQIDALENQIQADNAKDRRIENLEQTIKDNFAGDPAIRDKRKAELEAEKKRAERDLKRAEDEIKLLGPDPQQER